jgi:N-acetylglucosaminyldiphosphoundecaprenol N-acetyl-beta-D-mannosaminyltransferase
VNILPIEYLLNSLTILCGEKKEIYNFIAEKLFLEDKLWIVTLNALMYMEYIKGNEYSVALKEASFSIPDGVGIVKLLKKKGIETERCPGYDTMEFLLRLSTKQNYKVYLLGSTEEAVKKASENIVNKFGTAIVGYHHGYFDWNMESEIVEDINNKKADLVFVGMGIPKQEIFIKRNIESINAKLLMGVGGSFDVLAGEVKRAPQFYQKLGLEWFYRMIKEPRRIKKIPDLVKFYLRMFQNKD